MDRAAPETKIAEVTVELEELCAICRDEPDPSNAVNLAVSCFDFTVFIALLLSFILQIPLSSSSSFIHSQYYSLYPLHSFSILLSLSHLCDHLLHRDYTCHFISISSIYFLINNNNC